MPASKLFISHAAADKRLVQAFVELLEGGIGVAPHDIFCSSLKGQGIRPGADFKTSIRSHLDDATCVIALVSSNFYASAFCMCELGGVWLQAKNFIPILVPPLEFGDLKAVLAGLQVLRLADQSDLDELRDEIGKQLAFSPLSTARWNERRDGFLGSLPDLLEKLKVQVDKSRGPAESPNATRPISDEGALLKLEAWIKKLPDNRYDEAISVEQIDNECRLVASTAERLIGRAVAQAGGGYRIRGPVDGIVVFSYKRKIGSSGGSRGGSGGWSPSRDGFGDF